MCGRVHVETCAFDDSLNGVGDRSCIVSGQHFTNVAGSSGT